MKRQRRTIYQWVQGVGFWAALGASTAGAGTIRTFSANTDLTNTANYSPSGTINNTVDVRINTGYPTTTTTFTITASNLTMGSLNDLNQNAITISNRTTTSTNSTLALGGGGNTNAVSGANSADLIYLGGTTSNLTIKGPNDNTGTGVLNLTLGNSGNFNVANSGASLTITSAIGETGGARAISKTGLGTLTLGGATANTYTGATTVSGGLLILDKSASVNAIAGDLVINSGGTVRVASNTTTSMFNTTASNITINGGTLDVQGAGFRSSINTLTFNSGTLTDGDGTPNAQINVGSSAAGAITMRGGLNVNVGIAMQNAGGMTYDAVGNLGSSSFDRGFTLVGTSGAVLMTVGDSSGTSRELTLTSSSGFNSSGNAYIGLTKTGAGTLVLPSAGNSFSGTMTLAQGTLLVGANALGGTAVSTTGNITSGTNTLTVASAAGLAIGMNITGPAFNSTATTISNISGTTITLSNNANSTSSGGTFQFGTRGALGSSIGGAVQIATSGSGSTPIALLTDGAYTVGRNLVVNNLGSGTITLGGDTSDSSTFSGNVTLGRSIRLQSVATGSNAVTFSGTLSGAGGVNKIGDGLLVLSGANNYTGATTVSAGTLSLGTSGSLTSHVTVLNGATLTGAGTIQGNLNVNTGGILAPGNSPGLMIINGNYVQNGMLVIEIAGDAGPGVAGGWDQVQVNGVGTVTLTGGILSVVPTGEFTIGDSFVIIDNLGSDLITTTFAGLAEGALFWAGSYQFMISYAFDGGNDGHNNDVRLYVNAVVPEPSTFALFSVAFVVGLRGLACRRKKHSGKV